MHDANWAVTRPEGAPVSVCMATCNGGHYLEAQLDSIVGQLLPGDELVVSDDSSQDNTIEILKNYEGPYIRLSLGNRFHSPIGNFENCLRLAGHEILVLADQDDIWMPSRLKVVRRHLGNRTGQACAVMTDAKIIDSAGQLTGETLFGRFHATPGILRNIAWNCYTGCAMAFTRPLLELALPFPKGIPMHDAWLGLLADAAGTMELIAEPTLCYRRHSAAASGFRWQPIRQASWRLALAWHLCMRLAVVRKGPSLQGEKRP